MLTAIATIAIVAIVRSIHQNEDTVSAASKGTVGESNTQSANMDSLDGPSAQSINASDRIAVVKGAGHNWGAALKTVYASAKIAPDGKLRLNVTALEGSFKGYPCPVDLNNSSEPAGLRAEYLASSVTSALDLNATHQPELAALIKDYYATDSQQSRVTDEAERTRGRSELCKQARVAITSILPGDVREQFTEMFRSENFLFQSRSVSADTIEMERKEFDTVASDGAVFTIANNGALEITAGSFITEHKTESTKPQGK